MPTRTELEARIRELEEERGALLHQARAFALLSEIHELAASIDEADVFVRNVLALLSREPDIEAIHLFYIREGNIQDRECFPPSASPLPSSIDREVVRNMHQRPSRPEQRENMLLLPWKSDDRRYVCLFLGDDLKHREETLDRLLQQANAAWRHHDRQRRQQKERDRQRRFHQALLGISHIHIEDQDIDSAWTRLRAFVRTALRVSSVRIHWRGGTIPPLRQWEIDIDRWLPHANDECVHGCWAAKEGDVVSIDDIAHDGQMFAHCPLHRQGALAILAAPIRIWGHVVGILCCEQNRTRHWSDEEREFSLQVAEELARLYHEAVIRQSLSAILHQRDILRSLLQYAEHTHEMPAADLCRYTRAFSLGLDGVEMCHIGICPTLYLEESLLTKLRPFIEHGQDRICCHRGCNGKSTPNIHPCYHPHLQNSTNTDAVVRDLVRQGMRSALFLHLLHDGTCNGSLCFASSIHDAFDRETQNLLRTLGQMFSMRLASAIVRDRLRHSERRIQHVGAAAGTYVWETDAQGRYCYLTESCSTIKGKSIHALIGSTPFALMPEEDRKRYLNAFSEACRKRQDFHIEHRNLRPDGSTTWEEVHATPLLDDQGRLLGFSGTGTDITERKRQQHAMQNLIGALDQAGESVIITDERGCIEYVNLAFQKVTGYSLEEVRGKNPNILQSGRQDANFYRNMWAAIQRDGEWQGVLWNKRKNGEIYPERLHIRAIRDQEGRLRNYVGVFSDITEQLSIEEQLRQSQKMEAIGTLVGGVAHNFNNMLAGIIGKAYIARMQLGNCCDEVRKEVEDIEHIGHRAGEMIRKLMAFAHKSVSLKAHVQLQDMLRDAVETARLGVPEDIDVHLQMTEEPLESFADAMELQQVVMNMINNARDALREWQGEKRIDISLHRIEASASLLRRHPKLNSTSLARLDIADSGPGIPEEVAKRIFEPFFTTKEVGQGTGLGLSMALGTVESHGGVIELHSRPGNCRFSIYLPATTAEQAAPRQSTTSIRNSFPHLDAQEQGHVLIVDDEAVIRDMCAELISGMGLRCESVENGDAALRLVDERGLTSFSLMITDVVMPGIDGIELAQRLWKRDPRFPVIFITGYEKNEVQLDDSHIQHTSVLGKPFSVESMIQDIRRLLYGEKGT